MDIDTAIRAALLIIIMLAYLGLVRWAWSKDRKQEFERMSRLPLDADLPKTTNGKK